ncbi:Protein FAR1-related sequence 5 [Vitis vinifera]|uniref:Protein FAR1-related sequence 5 n=2 Tax=Vitis vinifera TaxID=29760 RepID=A0A438C423_VITVI|nr:Protein FAR1-related sequence 5 [Vitis vinifera]
MTLSNSVYLQIMQSVKEKTIKREFEVKEEDVVNDDAFIGATYDLGGNGLKQKVLKGISDEEVYKLQFDRIDEAETFYNMLARVAGFSIRKDDLKRDKNGDIISRKWVCSREGQRATKFIENDKRQREPRSLTRVGCEAAFRVGLNRKDGKWIVKEFIGDHNHNLVDAINTQFLRSHRTISNPDKAQVDVLRKVGVKTTQIMDYMVKQSGGHEHVGFTQKDIYNHVDAMRRSEIKDGDAEAALAYLCGKAEMDSSFFYKFNIDEESRLANLFWADSTARMDYACFGDVLAFDTTYRTNAYKKPLVVLVGVNHHHQTVVFGCALLIDERLLKHICKVHVHAGNEEEFEKVWHEMVANLGLNENRWVTEIYGKRKRWAEAYLRGNFFGGMRTTQRAILRIRQNEAKAEFESNNSSPVLSTKLAILENHAATVYTKESFLKFREEMKNAELFFVVGVVEHLEEIPQSCIMKRWTKLAKVYTRSVPVNETDNNMDRFVRYGSLSSMCNKLSYFASDTSSSFIEAKNEIQNLTARMEELYNYNLKGKKIASDGATGTNQVRDPNIVKTKGNPGKVAMNVQKGRRCSRCKRVGHTIRKCPEATIPQNAQPGYMEETNLSSQCDIQREMMPSTNSSVDIFATLHGMLGEQLPNDPSDMYIDWGELNNIAGFQQHEQSMSTPCEGGDPNKYPNEKDMQPFFYSLAE